MRGNWALTQGLMRLAGRQYSDQITQPGEEVFCRCTYLYVYGLADIPPDMLTELGRERLAAAKQQVAALVGA